MVTVTVADKAIIGFHLSLGVTTTIRRPFRWHWLRNGILIPGAPSACAYALPPLTQRDLDSKFSCRVYGLDGEVETSEEVELNPKVVEPVAEQVKKEAESEVVVPAAEQVENKEDTHVGDLQS